MQSLETAEAEMASVENVEAEAVVSAPIEESESHAVAATVQTTVEPQKDEATASSGEMELKMTPAEAEEKTQATDEVKAAEGAPALEEADQVLAAEVAQEEAAAEKADEAQREEPLAVEEKVEMSTDHVATGEVARGAHENSDGKIADGAEVEMKDGPLQQDEAADEATIAASTRAECPDAPADTCSQSNKFDSMEAAAPMEVDGNNEGAKAPTPTTDAPATSGDEATTGGGEVGENAAADADVGGRPLPHDGAPEAKDMQPAIEEPVKRTESEPEAAADGGAAMEVDAGEHTVPAEDVKPVCLETTPVKDLVERETDTPEKAPQMISEPQTKRPLTPIFQFIQDNRAKIQQDFNVRKITDVAKIAKELFETLSDEERQFYEDQYEERKRAFEAFMATEQGEEHAKEKARRGGPSRSSRRAAPRPATKQPKAKAKASAGKKIASKVSRPTPPVAQYMHENRYRIMAEHGVKRAIDVPKKAKELFDQLPEEQKKTFQDRYEQQKVAWTQFKASEKTAIKQYKTQLNKQKEQEEIKRKGQLGSAFKAGAKPPPKPQAKRSRKAASSSAPSRSAKQAKVTEVPVVLSPAGVERAKKMGVAPSGIPYMRLLEKLLATPHMEQTAEDEALDALKKFKGNVNLARNTIRSKVIEL